MLFLLAVQKPNLSAILLGAHGKMNPIPPVFVLFDKELIKRFFRFISIIHKDRGIAYRLLDAITADIHCATSLVIRGRYASYLLI